MNRDRWVIFAIVLIFLLMLASLSFIPMAVGFKESVYR